MSRRRAGRPSGGDDEQHAVAFADRSHAGVVSPAVTSPPPKLIFDCSVVESGEAVLMSPTSILQAAAVSPMSPATRCVGSGTAVPFSRAGGGSVGSGERRSKQSQRPWEAKPVGLSLVGALNREAPDDVSTVVTGQIKPCSPAVKMTCAAALSAHPSPARHAFGCMDDFLRRCHGCSKELGQGRDIFIYRGERAFCSRECRYREMLYDDNGTEF